MSAISTTIVLLAGLQSGAIDDHIPSRHAVALAVCREISGSTARLSCYDREVLALLAAAKSNTVVLVDRAEVRRARRKTFGFDRSAARPFGTSPIDKEDQADSTRLVTKILSGTPAGYGKWRFTITEGSVWETLESDVGFDDPKPGASVILERNAMGGFFAQIGHGRAVRAHRIG